MEVFQSGPRAAKDALCDDIIFKGDLQAIHRHIAEKDDKGQGNEEYQVKLPAPPHLFADRGIRARRLFCCCPHGEASSQVVFRSVLILQSGMKKENIQFFFPVGRIKKC